MEKLAIRFKVNRYVVGRAAIRYFLENAPDKFVPKEPKMDDKKRFLTLVLTPELLERVDEYVNLQNTTKSQVVRQALYNFLKLGKAKQYDTVLTQAAEEARQKEKARKEKLKQLKQLPPNARVCVTFKCDSELYQMLSNEAINERQTLAYIVKRAIAEFLQKYDVEKSKELVEKEDKFIGGVITSVKMPAEYLVKLEKIAIDIGTPRAALIRVAIVEYLKSKGMIIRREEKGI
ncbi:MAG: ribbon-helix-helix protein, CopG family [Thermoproteota archaeon]